MKRSEISVGMAVDMQFVPGGDWYPGVITAIDPAKRWGVAVQGVGYGTDGRAWFMDCDTGAKYLRPSMAERIPPFTPRLQAR